MNLSIVNIRAVTSNTASCKVNRKSLSELNWFCERKQIYLRDNTKVLQGNANIFARECKSFARECKSFARERKTFENLNSSHHYVPKRASYKCNTWGYYSIIPFIKFQTSWLFIESLGQGCQTAWGASALQSLSLN